MKRILAFALAMIMALGLAACTNSGSSSNAPASTPAGSDDATQTTGKPGEGYKIGVVMANLTNSNYIAQAQIYESYLAELGFEVLLTDTDNDTSATATAAENYATMGCDALIFSPLDDDVAISAAEAAKNINPDILIVNSVNDYDVFDFTVMQDEYDAAYILGVEAGKWINENQAGSADVGIIAIYAGALLVRVNGFKAGVDATVTGEVTYNEHTYDSASGRTGYEIMEDLMIGFPNVKCVYGAADTMSLGAFEAVKASNVNVEEYAFYGQDGTSDAMDAIQENSAFRATVDNGSTALAYAISDVVVKLVCEKVDPASFTVTIPAVVIDLDNVDGYEYDYGQVQIG